MISFSTLMAHRSISIVLLSAAFAAFASVSAQTVPPKPPSANLPAAPSAIFIRDGAIAVRSDINLSMCVNSAKLSVNSWDRNEIRVYMNDGTGFSFKVLERDKQSGQPAWVSLAASPARPASGMALGECLSADRIEIDTPRGTSLRLKGKTADVSVTGIARVSMESLGGDISLRKIANGISAKVYSGDISVEDSSGTMQIETTTGNIVVFEAGPSQSGDTFLAKANSGTISMQQLSFRQTEASSISGSVVFDGALTIGGAYKFNTSNGALRITMPADTRSQVAVTYGYGRFSSEIPVKLLTENVSPGQIKSIVGTLGGGTDTYLQLSTSTGTIIIRKQ